MGLASIIGDFARARSYRGFVIDGGARGYNLSRLSNSHKSVFRSKGVCPMSVGTSRAGRISGMAGLLLAAAVVAPAAASAQTPIAVGEVTFTKDIAPILQRSCENCHRADGVAPMSLLTYEEVRPWARAIKTAHRHRPEGRRDAALVRREEHRHPEVTRTIRR